MIFVKKWLCVLAVVFLAFGVSTIVVGEDLPKIPKLPEEPPDPLNFDSEDLYEYMEDGVRYNVKGFQSGLCKVWIMFKPAGIPTPIAIPITVPHITMHVPDLIVNVSSKPFNYLWQESTGIKAAQEELVKLISKLTYPIPIGGGPVRTKAPGGLLTESETRFKDVEIYGNPWILPFAGKLDYKIKFDGKKFKIKGLSLKPTKKPKGFYTLAQKHFRGMRFGCWTAFAPYTRVYNSEIDYFWRIPLPYLDMLLPLLPRTVGPGWVPFIGGMPGLDKLVGKVVSPLFPLKGFVTTPIYAHTAAVNALRAAYIATGSRKDWAWWTGHYPQHPASIDHSACGLLSHECKTYTSEEYKWGEDKVGLWQLIAPQPDNWIFPTLGGAVAFPLDAKLYLNYLQLIDKMVPPALPLAKGGPINPGEKYSFLHWRCHKCCDIPHGLEGLISVETEWVVETTDSCLPPETEFEQLLKDYEAQLEKASELLKGLEKAGESGGGTS